MFRFVMHCFKIKIVFLGLLYLPTYFYSVSALEEDSQQAQRAVKRKLMPIGSEDEDVSGGNYTDESEAAESEEQLPFFPMSDNRAPTYGRHSFLKNAEESDDEDDQDPIPAGVPIHLNDLIERGTQVKLMANVYLRDLCQRANVFIPTYEIEFAGPGQASQRDFFRTARKQVCVFVSGGLQNAWEKTVAWAFKKFFGLNIKIIRASWIQKHLYKDKEKSVRLEDQYKGREDELHSELYFDYFFRNFFDFSGLIGKAGTFTIRAFSWWDVCDACFSRLTALREVLPEGFSLRYEIVSHRHYSHNHQPSPEFRESRAYQIPEQQSWDTIWQKVMLLARAFSTNMERKKEYWTKTKDGLEICKWLAQAFAQQNVKRKIASKGEVSKYFQGISEVDSGAFWAFMEYLREENWDLSCWYKDIPYNVIQRAWDSQWSRVVMPHFNWSCIFHWEDTGLRGECDMCGKEGLRHTYWVYHPKYRVGKARLSEATLIFREASPDFNPTGFFDLHPEEWKRRKRSLVVGGECLKKLETDKETIDEWRGSEAYCNQRRRIDEDRALEEAERALKKREAEARAQRKKVRRKK